MFVSNEQRNLEFWQTYSIAPSGENNASFESTSNMTRRINSKINLINLDSLEILKLKHDLALFFQFQSQRYKNFIR